MKVDLTIAKAVAGSKNYYVVINDEFYINIKKEMFYEFAEYLKIDLEEKH